MGMIDYTKSHEWMQQDGYIDKFVGLVSLKKESYVLDAGCGSGYVADKIRPQVKDLLQIDHDWTMLSQNNVARHTETLKADLLNLWMIKDGIFDAVFCRSVFHRLREPSKAYQEFKRLLKPGGTLVTTVAHLPDTTFKEEYKEMVDRKGFRLYKTPAEWKEFFLENNDVSIIEEGTIDFDIDLNNWGLLKEHENASDDFKKHFKLENGIIKCQHVFFVIKKD
ncbi:class I SAM-dependent methyltransferase [Candidatus Woesearchaeota archaeon]|nr:class I SAM-dependent methyltransferase [Candidatus Woesearchaeota archaeon]